MFSFGFNSFLGFNMQGSPIVQELLSREDLTLEDLLDEEAVINEVKMQNQKLLDFLLKSENFKSLVNYAIIESELDELDFDQKKFYKYPFVCADLLSCESQSIVDEFFKSKVDAGKDANKPTEDTGNAEKSEQQTEGTTAVSEAEASTENKPETGSEKDESGSETKMDTSNEKDLTVESKDINDNDDIMKERRAGQELIYLKQLFSILDNKNINLTCAGYFAKIVSNLLVKRPAELLAYIFKDKKEILDKMVQSIYSKSIAELLAKLLTFESSLLAQPNDDTYNDERVRILKLIHDKLQPSGDAEEINNSAYLICEVFGKYSVMHGSQEVLGKLLERPVIDSLFSIMNQKSPISSCASALVLGNIFAYYILISTKLPTEPPSEEAKPDDQPYNPPHRSLTHLHPEIGSDIPLVAAFLENVKPIIDYLADPTPSDEITTQFGTKIAPLGATRLKFLELLIISIKANNSDIYAKLIEQNFFECLLGLIQRYEWNNMLHNQIEKIIFFALEDIHDELKIALFEKAGLLDFIIIASNQDDFVLKGKHERKLRRGYIGHLVKIANKIVENKDPVVEKYTQDNKAWNDFVSQKLTEINNRDKTILGGNDPRVVAASLTNAVIQSETDSIMEKFSKLFNLQPRSEQKDASDEGLDDGEGGKKNTLLGDVPKDELVLAQEGGHTEAKGTPGLEKAAGVVPPHGRRPYGANRVKKPTEQVEEQEPEEESNTEWFSDPEEPKEESKEEGAKDQVSPKGASPKAQSPKANVEAQPKDDSNEGENMPSNSPNVWQNEDIHTAEEILKEVEGKIE